MIKNPSSNVGDVVLIPGGGAKIPHAGEQLSLHTSTKTQHSQQRFTWGKVRVHKNALHWKKSNYGKCQASEVALVVKNLCANAEDLIPGMGKSPGGGNANPSSILAWRILWTEESGGLQSTGLQKVRHNWGNLANTWKESFEETFIKWFTTAIQEMD